MQEINQVHKYSGRVFKKFLNRNKGRKNLLVCDIQFSMNFLILGLLNLQRLAGLFPNSKTVYKKMVGECMNELSKRKVEQWGSKK